MILGRGGGFVVFLGKCVDVWLELWLDIHMNTTHRTTTEVTDNTGRTLGWATGPQRDGTWSLVTDNGLDLVAVATSVEDAERVLTEHKAERAGR